MLNFSIKSHSSESVIYNTSKQLTFQKAQSLSLENVNMLVSLQDEIHGTLAKCVSETTKLITQSIIHTK